MAVCSIETAGAGWHHLHCITQTATDLLALVSSYHCADVLVVLVHRIHRISSLVRCDELLCSLIDVHLLCIARSQIPPTTLHLDGDHRTPTDPNGRRMCNQRLGAWVPPTGRSRCLQYFADEHQILNCHVRQLFHSLRPLLPLNVFVNQCTQGQEAGDIVNDFAASKTVGPQSQGAIRWWRIPSDFYISNDEGKFSSAIHQIFHLKVAHKSTEILFIFLNLRIFYRRKLFSYLGAVHMLRYASWNFFRSADQWFLIQSEIKVDMWTPQTFFWSTCKMKHGLALKA